PLVPAAERLQAVLDVGVAQHLVHRRAERDRLADELPALIDVHLVAALEREVVLVALLLPRPALQPRSEELRRIGRDLTAEEVERRSEEHTLNSSHQIISYAVFCLKKKKKTHR